MGGQRNFDNRQRTTHYMEFLFDDYPLTSYELLNYVKYVKCLCNTGEDVKKITPDLDPALAKKPNHTFIQNYVLGRQALHTIFLLKKKFLASKTVHENVL